MPEITQVRTEADYDLALARISELLCAKPNSAEDVELDRVSTLVEIYEAEHYPMESPEPNSLIEFLLDQGMVSRGQMEALAGGSDSLEAILAGQQAVTAELAQFLYEYSGIPVEDLPKTPVYPATAASD